MPSKQKVPFGWRKALTSDEIIGTVIRARDGPAAGAVSAVSAAGVVAAAARGRRQMPGVWDDPIGTAGAAVQLWPEPQVHSPRSPGMAPSKAHHLAQYREYVGLQHWERIIDGLDREDVPIKRKVIDDYFSKDPRGPSKPLAIEDAPSTQQQQLQHQPLSWGVDSASSSAAAPSSNSNSSNSRFSAPAQIAPAWAPASARGAAATPPERWEPLATIASARRPAAAAEAPAAADSPTITAGRMCVGLPSPRMVGGGEGAEPAASAEPPFRAAASAEPPLLPPPARRVGFAMTEGPTESAPSAGGAREVPVRKEVAPNALGPADSWRRPLKGAPPRVQDRERLQYATARQMRPAREQNGTSRKKLDELLKLPKAHLDASKQHPSKCFNIVPSQNLRVI